MNPFRLIAELSGDAAIANSDPAWLIRAITTKALEAALAIALEAGPPEGFAAELGLDERSARVLYSRVLRAALLRQKRRTEMLTNV